MTSPIRGRVTRLVACASVAVMLAACSDGSEPLTLPSPTEEAAASPSPTEEPSPSPSPSPADPFAVPDEITADYVERVLNEINRLDADLARDILQQPVDEDATELPAEYRARLEEIFEDPILRINTNGTLDLLRSQEQRDDLVPADEYGQLSMPVEEVLATEPCVIARVHRDYSQVDAVEDTETSDLAFVFLVEASDENITGWKLASLVGSDAPPGSDDEEELRTYTANDLEAQAPEACA